MSDRLFINGIEVVDGQVRLGLAVGTPVGLSGVARRRDLPGGYSEHEGTLAGGEGQFVLRVLADAEGNVVGAIASPDPVADDWYEALDLDPETRP